MEYIGLQALKNMLRTKRLRGQMRYGYYEQKKIAKNISGVIPPEYQWVMPAFGWCATAVDSVADRLSFRGFDPRKDGFGLNEIYALNNQDVIFDSGMLSALITACSFIYVVRGADGFPKLQIIDGCNATGTLDPVTNMLKEGYAILETDKNGQPTLEAYFTAEWTAYYRNCKLEATVPNPAPFPQLVPLIHRPDAKRPFGHSLISRACMSLQGSAARTIMRSEVAAEFYSFPQKYVTGLTVEREDEDEEEAADAQPSFDGKKANLSSFLWFTADENGNSPKLGQFQQQSMAPFHEQLKMIASAFAGESGLTIDDLGFATDNPSSADAIKAAHERLRLKTRKAQKNFCNGFRNAGFIAACIRDGKAYDRTAMYTVPGLWEPIFEPDANMLTSFGDGVIKINQAVPGYFGQENLRNLTGIEPDGGA